MVLPKSQPSESTKHNYNEKEISFFFFTQNMLLLRWSHREIAYYQHAQNLAFQSHHKLIFNIIFILIDALNCFSAINKPFFFWSFTTVCWHFTLLILPTLKLLWHPAIYPDSSSSVSYTANHSSPAQSPFKNSFTQFYFPNLHCRSRPLTQPPVQHFQWCLLSNGLHSTQSYNNQSIPWNTGQRFKRRQSSTET